MGFKTFQSYTAFLVVTTYLLCTEVSTADLFNVSTPIIRYPGTVDVLAILHFRQTVADDFQCSGPFNYRVAYDVEALRFALREINENLGDDDFIGLTVVDTCGSIAVTLRDVVSVLTGKAEGLIETGPTIGILVPGVGEVTRTIYEQVTIPLGIPTIGYFPTEERFLRSDDVDSGMLMTGSVGVNEARGDNPSSSGGGDPSTPTPSIAVTTIRSNSTQSTNETEPQSTNVTRVTTDVPEQDLSTTMFSTDANATFNSSVSEMPLDNATTSSGSTSYTTSVDDTTLGGSSSGNTMGEENGDQQGGSAVDDVDGGIYLLTSAEPLASEASVITTVLSSASWYNIGLFYSGYGTGPSRRNAFMESAQEEGVCISFEQSIPRGLTQQMSDRIIEDLLGSSDQEDSVEVLVWIVSMKELQYLLRSISLIPETFTGVMVLPETEDTLEDFIQQVRLDSDFIVVSTLQNDTNPEFSEYLSSLNENTRNSWLSFSLMTTDVTTKIAPHTSSLIRAVEMIANCFIDNRDRTNSSKEDLSIPTPAVCNALLEEDFGNITKLYDVYFVNDTNVAEISTVSGYSPMLSFEEGMVTAAYRADGCICLASGLTPAEEVASHWTHDFSDPWVPFIFVLSLVFGLLAFTLFFVFIVLAQRPALQKTTLLANLLLLLGIMLMYFINMFYTRVPTVLGCGFRQFGTAFIYAWVFSALLVKCMAALINLRKDNYDTAVRARNKMGNIAQFSAFCAFLGPQIALSVQWIAFSPPKVLSDPDVCGDLSCDVTNSKIVISMIYVFILVLGTFILSLGRLREDSLMNESRSLFLSSLSTIFLLIGWTVAFTLADPVYNIPVLCIGVTLNATVILLASFGPACCIITYGQGTRREEEDGDANGDVAYVNPVMVPTTEYIADDDARTML